jgi:ADP-ribosylglycohydrolase
MRSLLLGVAVGDAMGVPFEFSEPEDIADESFEEMQGFGTHNQLPGTFSDDSSLTFCLVEALIEGLNQTETAQQFLRWKNEGYWTAHGEVFDIGIQTRKALNNFENGVPASKMALSDEWNNGNGALMRILPLAFYAKDRSLEDLFALVEQYASITHGHLRSHMACFILVKFAADLLEAEIDNSTQKKRYFAYAMTEIENFFLANDKFKDEIVHFERLFNNFPDRLSDIENSGYVIDSLEASLYSFMKYNRYEMIVISAIKLGGDTDTNAAIAGGLAAITYGESTIPKKWIDQLHRRGDIEELADRWDNSLNINEQ